MYLKLAVDACFPIVITAASCDFENKKPEPNTINALVSLSEVTVHVL